MGHRCGHPKRIRGISPGKVENRNIIYIYYMSKKLTIIVASALVLLPVLVGAQGGVTVPDASQTILAGGYQGIADTLSTIANWMLGVLLLLAVIFFIYAGFLYLTSGGEEEKVKKAKDFLVYGLIAVAVGLLAKGLVSVVSNLVIGGEVPVN